MINHDVSRYASSCLDSIRNKLFAGLFSVHSQEYPDQIARQLNQRPRKTLEFETAAQRFNAEGCDVLYNTPTKYTGT